MSDQIGSNLYIKIGINLSIQIGSNLSIQKGSNLSIQLGTYLSIQIGTNLSIQIGTNLSIQIDTNLYIQLFFYLSRDNKENRSAAVNEIIRRAQSDDPWNQFLIFPEGTTSNGLALFSLRM